MAVAIDASSPAIVAQLSSSVTTASFNPPDASVLVAVVLSATGVTMSNNGTALTWTMRKQDPNAFDSEIWTAPLATGRTGMTVTATGGGGQIALKVYVITGADASSPIGATGSGTSSTNNVTVNGYTSTVNGSRGIAAAVDGNGLGTPSSTDDESTFNLVSSGMAVAKAANTSSSGTTVTFNLDAAGTSTPSWSWIAVEVVPVSAVNATVTPTNVSAVTAVPSPSISTGSTVTPSAVAATTTVPAPDVSGGATVTPGAIAATTTIPAPVIATGGNITVAVDPIAAVATVPSPALLTSTTVTPGAVAAVATVPTPHIQLPESATVAAAPVAVIVAVPPPVISTPILPGAGITGPGQLEYDGFLLGSGTAYRMKELTGFDDLPAADPGNVPRPAEHGSWAGRTLARDRTITFTGFMSVAPSQLEATRNALINATPYPEGADDLPLAIRMLDTTYLVYAKVAPGGRIIGPINKAYKVGFAPIALQWVCADPNIYGITIRTADLANGGTISVLNAGNTPTRPTIRLSGPATNPQVTVVDTGRIMRFGIALSAGQYIDVDCRLGSALYMGTTSVLAALSSASVPPQLFQFPPGTSQITYSATGSSVPVANVLWRDATQ